MVAKKPAKSRRGLHLRLQAGDDLRRRPVQVQKVDYLIVVVRRDEPFSATETEWLRKIVSDSLNILSEITVETVPFVGELIYEDDRPDLT